MHELALIAKAINVAVAGPFTLQPRRTARRPPQRLAGLPLVTEWVSVSQPIALTAQVAPASCSPRSPGVARECEETALDRGTHACGHLRVTVAG